MCRNVVKSLFATRDVFALRPVVPSARRLKVIQYLSDSRERFCRGRAVLLLRLWRTGAIIVPSASVVDEPTQGWGGSA